jgi:Asp-tRNA(Asn)/Glu-tRNA(Gln) amidotransferase A subunit family amidase
MEWQFASAAEISRQLCSKQVSATEIAKYFLSRISKHNQAFNIFVHVDEELVLKQAAEIDARASGWGH